MDPLNAKLVQLFIAQGTGVVMLLGGVLLSLWNLAGKMHLMFQGAGFRVKMKNATPGIVIALVGLVLIWRSLDSTIEREETITIDAPPTEQTTPPQQPAQEDPNPVTTSPKQPDPPPASKTTQRTRTKVRLHHYFPWGEKVQVPYEADGKGKIER